jgi:lipopolysaccharide/colanic/teichoic acid biosynthesis glycosyltransferase
MSIAVRLANRTPTIPGSVCGKAGDPAIVTNDWAPVFLFSRAAKRAFDVVAAIVGLVLFSPMFLLVAIAIKTDSRGPVFHPQTVYGYNYENIRVLKFRTTIVWGQRKALQYVSRVGAVLRRTGIDGLPLLVNVLRGEMSIRCNGDSALTILADKLMAMRSLPRNAVFAPPRGLAL